MSITCSNIFSAWNFSTSSRLTFSDALVLSPSHPDRLLLLFSIFFVLHLIFMIYHIILYCRKISFEQQHFIFVSDDHLKSISHTISFLEGAKTDSFNAHASSMESYSMICQLKIIMILVKLEEMKLTYAIVCCWSWHLFRTINNLLSTTSFKNCRGTLVTGAWRGLSSL